MSLVEILIGDARFVGRLEQVSAPRACVLFKARLPYSAELIHARWSGEACWIPTGDAISDFGPDAMTSEPQPGQILYYGGGRSEPEILVPYGQTRFACAAGSLAGSHILTIDDGLDRLAIAGRQVLHRGAQPIRFALI
jgi:hypothetical protein